MPSLVEIAAHLDEASQRRHATMVLGGWKFVQAAHRAWWLVSDPNGNTVASNGSLYTAVQSAWFTYGGNGA